MCRRVRLTARLGGTIWPPPHADMDGMIQGVIDFAVMRKRDNTIVLRIEAGNASRSKNGTHAISGRFPKRHPITLG